jgi:hypothetical protein
MALLLLGDWPPAKPPPPTAWAKAGARPFAECRESERQAAVRRRGPVGPARGTGIGSQQLLWSRRARRCPNAPLTLAEAATEEIVLAGPLLRGVEGWGSPDPAKVEEVVGEHRRRLRRALVWIDRSIAESDRRGDRPPREVLYWRAYALTGLGRIEDARQAVSEVSEQGDIAQWRAVRLAALIEVMDGQLDEAVRLSAFALRATEGAGSTNDREISRYIRAFVLARAGADEFARQELQDLRRGAGNRDSREAVESVLPIHERLFLRAVDHSANEEDANALRLWTAYLARPEPEEPERVLAQRYLDELSPPGPMVGS